MVVRDWTPLDTQRGAIAAGPAGVPDGIVNDVLHAPPLLTGIVAPTCSVDDRSDTWLNASPGINPGAQSEPLTVTCVPAGPDAGDTPIDSIAAPASGAARPIVRATSAPAPS